MSLLVLVLESVLAGAILVGIVWWTIRPVRRRDRGRDDGGAGGRQ